MGVNMPTKKKSTKALAKKSRKSKGIRVRAH